MTAVPDVDQFRVTVVPGATRRRGGPAVTETFWGYRIAGRQAPMWLVGLQGLWWTLGLGFGLVAIGIWVAPGAGSGAGLLAFKLGASVPLAALAALLLAHAGRGTTLAVEVDLRLGEVREVITSRTGRAAVLARHGFDAVAEVTLARMAGGGDAAMLVLRLREDGERVPVARGSALLLTGLQERLERDLMLGRRARLVGMVEAARHVPPAEKTEAAAA